MHSRYGALDPNQIADERLRMMESSDTLALGTGNHADRKMGSMIARLSNVSEPEIDALGLWDPTIMKKHYLKLRPVETIFRMSGFLNASDHWVGRAQLDPLEAMPEAAPMFQSFLPFLDNPVILEHATDQLKKGKKTEWVVFCTLKYIRAVACARPRLFVQQRAH